MPSITIDLPDSLSSFVEARASAGGYESAGAFVQALVLEAQQRELREEIDGLLIEGVDALERKGGREMRPEDWEALRQQIRQRSSPAS